MLLVRTSDSFRVYTRTGLLCVTFLRTHAAVVTNPDVCLSDADVRTAAVVPGSYTDTAPLVLSFSAAGPNTSSIPPYRTTTTRARAQATTSTWSGGRGASAPSTRTTRIASISFECGLGFLSSRSWPDMLDWHLECSLAPLRRICFIASICKLVGCVSSLPVLYNI